MDPNLTAQPKRRKKKKLSYVQQAKKFARRGKMGRGQQLEQDVYQYFLRVMEQVSKEDFQDPEAEELFVANVFQQTEGQESALCANQLVSRVIETLLPKASEEVQERFMSSLGADLRISCTDAFASHVLERLLDLASFGSAESESDDFGTFKTTWMTKVARFVVNNMDEFAYDCYASHILRTCFQGLAGIRLAQDVLKSKRSRDNSSAAPAKWNSMKDNTQASATRPPTDEMLQILVLAVDKVVEIEDKKELIGTETSSGVVQALISVLAQRDLDECKRLCKAIVSEAIVCEGIKKQEGESSLEAPPEGEEADLEEKVPTLFTYPAACRTVETILQQSTVLPKLYKKLYKKLFQSKIVILARHSVANYAVQKLLLSCNEKELFERCYEDEIDANLEHILSSGNTGVIHAIARTCNRLKAKQNHFLLALMKSLHCFDPSSAQVKLAPLLCHMVTREVYEESSSSYPVHLHGSLLMQELLTFNKPIKVVTSLLGMEREALKTLLCDPRGCHITDAFVTSPFIGEKSRDGLVRSLEEHLVAMACSKHGSRSLDILWKQSSLKSKEIIAAKLSAKEALLKSDQHGKFFYEKCSLSAFKRARDTWKQIITRDKKRRELFSDFLSVTEHKADASEASAPKKAKLEAEQPPPPKSSIQSKLIELSRNDAAKSDSEQPKKKKKKVKSSYLDDL